MALDAPLTMRNPPSANQLPLMWAPPSVAALAPVPSAGGPTAADLAARPRRGLGSVGAGAQTEVARAERAAIMTERLLRYHRTGRGGSPAHRLAGALLAEHGRDARLALPGLEVEPELARRADRHLEMAGVPAATRRRRELRAERHAALEAQARALFAAHGAEARVVLRRQRWAGTLDRDEHRLMDGHLAALGAPARLQIDLLGGDDAPA